MYMTTFRRPMQRSRPVLVLSCRIGAMLEEEPLQIHMTPSGRPMQWTHPILVLNCHIGAMFNEEPGHIYMTFS